jgi:AraC-like DNA-binding protein
MLDVAPPTSRVLCDTGLVRIGAFAVHPADPRFAHAGQYYGHEFVFPRSTVWIHRPGRPSFVADPTVVTFYNHGEPYSRGKISERGDHCDWFAVGTETLLEVVRAADPRVDERPERPFAFTHGPSDATSYRLQRLAVANATSGSPDALLLEELALHVLARVVRAAHAAAAPAPPAPVFAPSMARSRELAQRVQLVLADRWAEPLGLTALAREVASSPYHLCRAFKVGTGMGLARYRTQLRLRHALERVAEPDADLSRVALDAGFASHSHFSAAFRGAFGEPPSAFRRAASGERLRSARARQRAV